MGDSIGDAFRKGRLFFDHLLLLIFIDGAEASLAGDHDVGSAARIAHLVDALSWSKLLDLDLARQNGKLFIIEQPKKRNVPQCLGIACHESTSSPEIERVRKIMNTTIKKVYL